MMSSEDYPKLSVLAVDDEPENLQVVERILRKEFEVVPFSDPEEALRAIENRVFSLILADQRMPKITGVQLLERARCIQPRARRVVLSAFTDPRDLLDAINNGQIHRYLTKPIHSEELLSCVRALTAGRNTGDDRWIVVDADVDRSAEVATILVDVADGAKIKRSDHVIYGPNTSLILLIDPSEDAVADLNAELGGRDREVAIMVAATSHNDIPDATYMQAGADDVLTLPLSPLELHLRFLFWGERRSVGADGIAAKPDQTRRNMVAKSSSTVALVRELEELSKRDSTICFTGDWGVGMSTLARFVHDNGYRKEQPFIQVELWRRLSSEVGAALFGKGDAPGALNSSDKGTVYLAGLEKMPPSIQDQLAEYLTTTTRKSRLVASTNNLEDLTPRLRDALAVTSFEVPSLSERPEDLVALAHHFANQAANRLDAGNITLDQVAIESLKAHAWSDNIAELERVIDDAVVRCQHKGVIEELDLIYG